MTSLHPIPKPVAAGDDDELRRPLVEKSFQPL